MKEIGGYIELDTYTGFMLHDDGIKLNCGRKALEYLIKTNEIKNILMPKFMCDSCEKVLRENSVTVRYYSIGLDFKPIEIIQSEEEWLYIVNYYGQLSNNYIKTFGEKIILDNTQAYFQSPIAGVKTIYSCRKYFGVPDGAILYTKEVPKDLPRDESFERMRFLLGRFERSAEEFYAEYVENNALFDYEPIKRMSKLTENLLHGIDYEKVRNARTENFKYLNDNLSSVNRLKLNVPDGAFMYPLYLENGTEVRKRLQMQKVYIPTLWPSVFEVCKESDLEYDMAKNILPLPVDQRYSIEEMEYIIQKVKNINERLAV